MKRPTWQPALQLNEGFYREVVQPLVERWPHAAALLGWGSDVLGYDTEQSADHGWGVRLLVFVGAHDVLPVRSALDVGLPDTFERWPVRYGWDDGPVQHHVRVDTLHSWLLDTLGVDPRGGLSAVDWLVLPQQSLLGVTRGAVYADQLGELRQVRELLTWYPRDVWLWLLASQWDLLGQEEAFVGRAAQVGDDLGSRVVTARQVRQLMRMCLLLGQEYWPYSKWLGTAFGRLPDADGLGAVLAAALDGHRHEERERALATAYELVARRHNASGLTAAPDPGPRQYHGRPFTVLMAERFVTASLDAIADQVLRRLPLVGSVDQFVDSTHPLTSPHRLRRLRALYDE